MREWGLWRVRLPAACVLLLVPTLARAGSPSLSHAEALYEIRDVDGAEHELRALLTHKISARVAATAHLYLGMVALEGHSDLEGARLELARALKLDPRISMPLSATPEEQQLLARVREQNPNLRGPNELPSGLPPEEPAPAAAVSEGKPTAGHGPWPWVLGGGAVVAVGVSVWGFSQVAADNSTAAQSRTQPVSLAQAQSAVSQGQLGLGVGIATAVVAVALGAGAVWTW
jgi:hypothetical protein